MSKTAAACLLVLGVAASAQELIPAAPVAGRPAAPLPRTLKQRCFPGVGDPTKPLPDYEQFSPIVGSHCRGTNHQAIDRVEKVVFLGDSITEGTPPTPPWSYYRAELTRRLEARFGELEVADCAAWGATTEDVLGEQLPACFPGPEPKRTLVVMTAGGNDMRAVVKAALGGEPTERTLARVDRAARNLRAVLAWLKRDSVRFPNGVFVVFSNIYEYTDAVGDLPVCPAARVAGLDRPWPEGRWAYVRIAEAYMRVAVETRTDMIFLLEDFCGHGYHNGDSANECYRGADAERWIDLTCIHPTPAGHARIAELFMNVVQE